jgi:hypothetical protein
MIQFEIGFAAWTFDIHSAFIIIVIVLSPSILLSNLFSLPRQVTLGEPALFPTKWTPRPVK